MVAKVGFSEVRMAAQGQWYSRIFPGMGICTKALSCQRHQPCPGCGGRDRFRWDKRGSAFGRWCCGGGGRFQTGDGFDLLGHVHGWDRAEQLKQVKAVLGMGDDLSAKERQQIQRKAAAFAEKQQKEARIKDERLRTDNNLLALMWKLEDQIHFRNHCHRATGQVLHPMPEEIELARELNMATLEAYVGAEVANV